VQQGFAAIGGEWFWMLVWVVVRWPKMAWLGWWDVVLVKDVGICLTIDTHFAMPGCCSTLSVWDLCVPHLPDTRPSP